MTNGGSAEKHSPADICATSSDNSESITPLLSGWQRDEISAPSTRSVELDPASASRRRGAQEHADGNIAAAAKAYVEASEFSAANGDALAAIDDLQTAIELEIDELLRGTYLQQRAMIGDAIRHEDASRYWHELAEHCKREAQVQLQAQALLHSYFAAEDDRRGTLLDEARNIGDDNNGWSVCAAAVAELGSGNFDSSVSFGERAIELGRIEGDRLLEAMSSRIIGIALSYRGETERAIMLLKNAITLATLCRSPMEVLRAKLLLIDVLHDDLKSADALTESRALQVYVSDNHLVGWQADAECSHALALLHSGRLTEARECAETRLPDLFSAAENGADLNLAFQAIICGYILTEVGVAPEPSSLETAANLIEEAADAAEYESFAVEARFLRARAFAMSGDLSQAIEIAVAIDIDEPQTMAMVGQWLARVGSWHSHQPEYAVDAQRAMRRAQAIGESLATIPSSEATARVVALTAEEILATTAGNIEGLRRSARRWRTAGRALSAARCAAFAANYSARQDCEGAVASLLDAYQDLLQLGAAGDAAILARHLYETSAAAADISDLSIDDATLLDRGSAFASLEDTARTALLSSMASMAVRAGTQLGNDDRTSESLMMIRSGSVRLYRPIDNGKQMTLALLERGDVFGADSLLGVDGRQIHAEVTDDAQLGVVPAAHLRQLIRSHPQIALQLLDTVGDRLTKAQQLAEQVAYWSVRRRVAAVLIELDDKYGHPTLAGDRIINKTISQAEIADLIGATRKAVTESLSKMRGQGLVDSRGRRIVLVGISELQRIADGNE